ncbi:uncharacterized protein LOC143478281 [Brachyhypopomus gauderio]|uniref:uncharacterized protein LOC143478281 n=1 Tax=Brachyhypopomus gauderio TaxID=698409 RepID=UPI0040425D28
MASELYYHTQAHYQSSVPTTPIIFSSAQQQQALPPQQAPPQQHRLWSQSRPMMKARHLQLVVPAKLTTEPILSQDLQLASPLSTVPVGQDSDFGAPASPPPPLMDLPPADIPALEPKMGDSMDAPLLLEAVPQAEKEPVETPLDPPPADVEKAESEVEREQEPDEVSILSSSCSVDESTMHDRQNRLAVQNVT